MPSYWNRHYHTSTEVDQDYRTVQWTERKIRPAVAVNINTATNGYILTSKNLQEVYTSLWDLKNRLDELVNYEQTRVEAFLPEHYSPEDLKKMGLAPAPETTNE